MSRSLTRTQAILLGVLVVTTLVLGGSGLLALNERAGWGGGSIRVLVGFPDVGGVEVGTRVRIQGIDTGEIEAIHAPKNPGEAVKLQLRIAGKYRHLVREDAKVQIGSDSLLAAKIVRILPGSAGAKPIEDYGELKADIQPDPLEAGAKAIARVNSILVKTEALLDEVDKEKATLGKVLNESIASLQDIRRMVTSVQQNSDAIKTLPIVRSYVVDYKKELLRPDRTRHRLWVAEKDLFEPGTAVLTPPGKKKLDGAADWLIKHKYDDSEILVAAFADPSQPADVALTVTQKQSDVAVEYLRSKKVHHTGWWWWSVRPIRGLGCGNNPSPVIETEKMPAARVEFIVFVPQK